MGSYGIRLVNEFLLSWMLWLSLTLSKWGYNGKLKMNQFFCLFCLFRPPLHCHYHSFLFHFHGGNALSTHRPLVKHITTLFSSRVTLFTIVIFSLFLETCEKTRCPLYQTKPFWSPAVGFNCAYHFCKIFQIFSLFISL